MGNEPNRCLGHGTRSQSIDGVEFTSEVADENIGHSRQLLMVFAVLNGSAVPVKIRSLSSNYPAGMHGESFFRQKFMEMRCVCIFLDGLLCIAAVKSHVRSCLLTIGPLRTITF
jgi:hypothetical protein